MVRTEHWNDSVEDLMRMLEYEPEGCFLAEVEGAPAGHVFSICYGKLGWIGMLIVKKQYRRMGIGKALMLRARQYLLRTGAETIRLEAVPEISQLYRSIGFVDEYDSLRFKGDSRQASSQERRSVTQLKDEMIERVAEFDAQYFGAARNRVLRKLYEAYPELCFVATSRSKISGYIMCRKADAGYRLGPWVSTPERNEDATGLLAACLSGVDPGEPVYVGVPSINHSAVEILQRFGFSLYWKSIRMCLGPELRNERARGIFAIGDAAKG
jgi:ribosomal protein S18 acetylase RimI-like enzyme